jgi:hypothetical protein
VLTFDFGKALHIGTRAQRAILPRNLLSCIDVVSLWIGFKFQQIVKKNGEFNEFNEAGAGQLGANYSNWDYAVFFQRYRWLRTMDFWGMRWV